MKTTLLTLAGVIAFASLSNAQNPKFGYTKPEIRPANTTVSCPMTAKERVTRSAAFAKGAGATITTTVVKHAPSCPMPQGKHCPALG